MMHANFFFGPIKIVKDIFVVSPVYEAGLETTFFDLLSAQIKKFIISSPYILK